MERVESCIIGEMVVGSPLFDEVSDEIEVSVEAGIQKCGKALIILLVDPD